MLSVNVGGIRQFDYHGQPAVSAIWKTPVAGRVAARGVNLEGDEQADRTAHGGPHKAVYAYAIEDLRWWQGEIGRELEHGQFGENLTTEGLDVSGALIGERWQIGSALFEVSEPRVPCWRLAVRMEDNGFPKRFAAAGRPGSYLRIVREGDVGAGDSIRIVERPGHDVSVGDVFRIFMHDRAEASRLLEVAALSAPWRDWAARQVERGTRKDSRPSG